MSIATSPQQTSTSGPAGTASTGATLRLVETAAGDEHRHRHRNAIRDEEHDLQGHALALESHSLRRRAERYADAIGHGVAVDDEQVRSVLRAFRAYRPFVFAADRAANDAAHRRLARSVAVGRTRRADTSAAPDASVASVA